MSDAMSEGALKQRLVGEPHDVVVRLAVPAKLTRVRVSSDEPDRQVDFAVRIVGAPAAAGWLVADLVVHQAADGEVAVRKLFRQEPRGRIPLVELCTGERRKDHDERCHERRCHARGAMSGQPHTSITSQGGGARAQPPPRPTRLFHG